MNIRPLCTVLFRVILAVVFAGIFYTGWMTVAILVIKSETTGTVLKTIIWLIAPLITAAGFATGIVIFELLPGTKKSKFLDIFKWSLAGCAIGAGSVVWFGPMLIVFGMFLVGTASVALREIIRLRRGKRNISCES